MRPVPHIVSRALAHRSPLALAGISLGYYLIAALALAAIQATIPSMRSAFEVVLGLCGVLVLGVCLRFAWTTRHPDVSIRRRHWLLLITVLSITFQVVRWYADGGGLSAKLGDDDEAYIFIAHQILGLIDGPPIFTFRMPGTSLLVAATLRAFGPTQLWIYSLVQRLMLASIPPMLYMILDAALPAPFAGLSALLFLATPLNDNRPMFALSELPYTVGTALTIMALWMALRAGGRRRVLWLGLAALALGGKMLIRPTGIVAALALAAALFIVFVDLRVIRRFALALLLVAPAALATAAIVTYNGEVAGVPTLSDLGGLNVLIHFGPRVSPFRPSPELRVFEDLLPELKSDELFMAASRDWYTAHYRAALPGAIGPEAFSESSSGLAAQVVREHPALFVVWMLQKLYTDLLYPRLEVIPITWYRPELVERPPAPSLQPPLQECGPQTVTRSDLLDRICPQHEQARAMSAFQLDLVELPAPLPTLIRLLTVSLPFRLRLLTWPFYWGLGNIASLIILLRSPRTRPFGWLLGAAFVGELVPLMIVAAVSTQYQVLYHPIFFVTTWSALGWLSRLQTP